MSDEEKLATNLLDVEQHIVLYKLDGQLRS